MNKDKAQKIAKLLEFERDFKTNPSVAILSENEKVISAVKEVRSEVEIIKDDSQKIVEAINTLDQNIEARIENKVASIPPIRGDRGYKGEKGDPGPVGPKGDTVIVDKIIERTEVVKEQPIIKTEVVKEIKTDLEPAVIRDRLESLKDEARLDASAIKGLEKFQKTVNTAIQTVGNRVAGVSKIVAGSNVTISSTNPNGTGEVTVNAVIPPVANAFTDLTDTFSDYTGLGGQGLRVNATEDGIDTYTPTDTDEKVKYDAGDPTAGYVADKFVAGTGISLAEGTGANENKLVITNNFAESQDLQAVTDLGATTTNEITVGGIITPTTKASTSAGGKLQSNNGTDVALFGAGGGANITFYDGVKLDSQTADRILATDSSKNIQALNTATYPSLTELSYIKGVTSGIQTQLGNKFDKTTDDTDDITDTATNRFTNDTDISRLANTSGTNTGDVTVLDSSEIDFTLTGQQITASLVAGSIDETKLDTSVNTSLDLADSALQSETDPLSLHLDQTTPQAISNIAGVTVATNDKVLVLDTSGSDNIKTVTTQSIANLYSETDPVFTASDFNGKSVVTTIGSPGTDTNIPTEKAVRTAISSFGGGDVSGPASAVNNNVVFFDGVTGKLIKDSGLALSGSNTGDNAVNSLYSGLVTNATHTGEVTGSGALTVDKTAITNQTGVTAATGDYVLISDVSDTNALKKVTTQSIADLKVETDPVWVSEKSGYFNKSTDDSDDISEGVTNLFDKTVALTAGTGISTSGTYPNFTITNSSPDQTVSIAGTTNEIETSGTYPSFTVGIPNNAQLHIDKITSLTSNGFVKTSGGDGDLSVDTTTYIPASEKAAALGVATLDAGGKIPTGQLPALPTIDIFTVASQAAMLALSADQGDMAIRTDVSKTFVLSSNSPSTLADWVELAAPTVSQFGYIRFTVGNGNSVITAGTKNYVAQIPYAGTITGWYISETSSTPVTGSIVVDVWKDTTGNYPPNVSDTIAGTEKPTLSSAKTNSDTTLSTWTTSVSVGDCIGFTVDSNTDCKRVTVLLKILKS